MCVSVLRYCGDEHDCHPRDTCSNIDGSYLWVYSGGFARNGFLGKVMCPVFIKLLLILKDETIDCFTKIQILTEKYT